MAYSPSEEEVEIVKEEMSTLHTMPKFPPAGKPLERYSRVVAQFASTKVVEHPAIGTVVPIEWLMDQVASVFVFFPSPIQMRQIYEKSFAPLDGRSSVELLDGVDG